MFLTPEILINLFIDTLSYIFLAIAFFVAVKIVLWFDFGADTPRQYALERQSYLASTIVAFVLGLKIPMIFYFIYTLDHLSTIIPGAMCAAGVVSANEYGVWLFVFKIIDIYLFALWLLLNLADLRTKEYRYTKMKFAFFILIFLFVTIELVLEYLFFHALDVSKVVSCCGVLFNPVAHSALGIVAHIDPKLLAFGFYLCYIALAVAAFLKRATLFGVLSLLFLLLSILAIIFFFSPYIYELPTHRCPFCFLQTEYHYIGYVIYLFLFLGTFGGIASAFWPKWMNKEPNLWISFLLDTIFVAIVSFYVLYYYYQNRVWLM